MNGTNSSLLANGSSELNGSVSSEPSDLVKSSMLCTLTITGSITVLMNVFVLTVIWRYTWMRTNANLIIASMAVTDLVAGVSAITSGLVKWTDFFIVGPTFCLVYNIIDITVAWVSYQHVLAVNLERYLAIIKPLHYKKLFQRYKLYMYIIAIWLWSLGLTLIYVFNTLWIEKCLHDIPKNPIWTLTSLILNYPIPLIVIIGIYIHIVIVIVQQLRFLKNNSSGNVRIRSKQMKMIKSVFSIFAAYLICWAPTYCVLIAVSLSLVLEIDLDFSNYVTLFYFVEVLSYANSLVNPCIYFLSSRSFQKAGRKMFHMAESSVQAQEAGGSSQHNIIRNRSSLHSHDSLDIDDKITVMKSSSVYIQETPVTHTEHRINEKDISIETPESSLNESNKTASFRLKNKIKKQNSSQIKASTICNKHDSMMFRKENFNQTMEAPSVLDENDKFSGKGHSDHNQETSEFYTSKENNQVARKCVTAKESAIQHKDNKGFMQNGDELMRIQDSSDMDFIQQQNCKKIQANQGPANYCNVANIADKDEITRL